MKTEHKTIIWAIIISIFVIVIALSGEDTSTQKKKILSIGDTGILNNQKEKTNCDGNSILATNQDNYDKFVKVLNADDKFGYMKMLRQNQLFIIPNCTKVKVIDSAFAVRKVRILEGEYFGTSGWTAYEFIK